MKRFYFLPVLSCIVLLLLICQTAGKAFAVNDSTISRRVKGIPSSFSYQSWRFHPSSSLATPSLAKEENVVNLKIRNLSAYELYGLQHLSRPDFVFVRFAVAKPGRRF